jgi:hypothetical protein
VLTPRGPPDRLPPTRRRRRRAARRRWARCELGFRATGQRRVGELRRQPADLSCLTGERGDTEVGQQGLALGGEQHVGRGDVAVHDALRMHFGKRLRERCTDRDDLARAQRAADGDQCGQAAARRIVEHQYQAGRRRPHRTKPQHVLVPHAGQQRGLAAQVIGCGRLCGQRVRAGDQPLQGDLFATAQFDRSPDLAGAPEAQQLMDAIARQREMLHAEHSIGSGDHRAVVVHRRRRE